MFPAHGGRGPAGQEGLHNCDGGNGLHGVFAPYPDKLEQGGHNMLQMEVRSRKDYIAEYETGTSFPWRVVIVTAGDTQLADNDMVYRLATPPSEDMDFSWVKPGKVAWDWWNDWNLHGVDFRAVNLKADLMQVIPGIDLKMLSDYAALGEGDYEMTVYRDGINADRAACDYVKETLAVPASRKVTVHLAPGGGYAAKIVKK